MVLPTESDTSRREFADKIDDLRRQKANIPNIRQEIARAKRAKIDVAEQELELDDYEEKLNAILAEYG